MVFPEPLPVTHSIESLSPTGRGIRSNGLGEWLDTRYDLETYIIRLYKKNKVHHEALEKVKQDKNIAESTRKRLVTEIGVKIRHTQSKMDNSIEVLTRVYDVLKYRGICVISIQSVLDRLD
ncbi:hypothetical protein C7212DRAFT_314256 [Tuber magnatum]|uniref:Uncharacterized protein n=1 Tax=Tuber magnatum TaxID=42249 RepID=A0A317SST6_9PEZI|nr:hypothetical protein C7212DRAFT_314256 [Tuber magnatum]